MVQSSKWTGGHVEERARPANDAQVVTAQSTQTQGAKGEWVITLKDVPRIANYTKGMKLDYFSKGTNNPNSRNDLVVTDVIGPAKYKCTGPYPINL
jgi:hypothetical protein